MLVATLTNKSSLTEQLNWWLIALIVFDGFYCQILGQYSNNLGPSLNGFGWALVNFGFFALMLPALKQSTSKRQLIKSLLLLVTFSLIIRTSAVIYLSNFDLLISTIKYIGKIGCLSWLIYWLLADNLENSHSTNEQVVDRSTSENSPAEDFSSSPETIIWARACGNYVELKTVHGKSMLRSSFKQFCSQFESEKIRQVHRSHLVNLDHVEQTVPGASGTCQLMLADKHLIPVSKRLAPAIKQQLSQQLAS